MLANVDRPSDSALDTEFNTELEMLDGKPTGAVLPVAALDSVIRSERILDTLPGRLEKPLRSTFNGGLPLISGRLASVGPLVSRSGKWIVLLWFLKRLL